MARIAMIERTGGPEVIAWRDVDLPPPAAGQVQVRHRAVGLNFIDIYHRDGTYEIGLPGALGLEAVGEVVAVGEGVDQLAVGDRVATFGPERGAYATARNVTATTLLKLPDDIERNLAENFGNWRQSDPDYISHLQSPSTVDVGGKVFQIVGRIRALEAINEGKLEKLSRVIQIMTEHQDRPGGMSAHTLELLQTAYDQRSVAEVA